MKKKAIMPKNETVKKRTVVLDKTLDKIKEVKFVSKKYEELNQSNIVITL